MSGAFFIGKPLNPRIRPYLWLPSTVREDGQADSVRIDAPARKRTFAQIEFRQGFPWFPIWSLL